jgi:dynein heavy chain
MNGLERFAGILEHFMAGPEQYQVIFDSVKPNEEELPEPWNDRLNTFEKILFLKALRSDKVIPAI